MVGGPGDGTIIYPNINTIKSEPSGEIWGLWGVIKRAKIVKNSENK